MNTQATSAALRASGENLINANQKTSSGDKLQKDDFLKLLMTQMTNQDPLNPLDSKGMMDQFAQMGSLEQLQNINGQLGELKTTQEQLARSNTYTFLDKDVTVQGGLARVENGHAPAMSYDLTRDANVRITINDGSDHPVRNIDLGFQGPGNHPVGWDGMDDDGAPVPNGEYTYHVKAETDDGSEVPVNLFTTGKVSGIRFQDGRSLLRMNGNEYDLRDVIGVSNESERRFGGRQPIDLREEMTPLPPVTERTR